LLGRPSLAPLPSRRPPQPENFLLTSKTSEGELKLTDFGLGVFFKHGERFRDLVGSPYYVGARARGGKVEMWIGDARETGGAGLEKHIHVPPSPHTPSQRSPCHCRDAHEGPHGAACCPS
jgi:hypothetical protein